MMSKNYSLLVFCLFLLLFSGLTACITPYADNGPDSVILAGREWMAKNLDVERYRNGDPVRHAATEEEWRDAIAKEEGVWCYYENDESNGRRYGKLYNWYAVNDPKGLAPEGWHIPSDAEWQALVDELGGDEAAGSELRERKGFHAIAAGSRNCLGIFYGQGMYAYFWTSSEAGQYEAWDREIAASGNAVRKIKVNKSIGFSVRCVKGRKVKG